jgi:hypothetical protein
MEKDKKARLSKRTSEPVETPEPPQVINPSVAPDSEKNSDKKEKRDKRPLGK